jgi:NAD(P)-dependent dehydrogenase (short-subunit alcohol dehydrogenase family)
VLSLNAALLLLQVLINNAGMSVEGFEDGLAQLSSSSLADTLAVNTYAPLLVVQQLLKQVRRVEKWLQHLCDVFRSACRTAVTRVVTATGGLFQCLVGASPGSNMPGCCCWLLLLLAEPAGRVLCIVTAAAMAGFLPSGWVARVS